MASFNTYLVPVDFSRGSRIAFRHAVKLARRNRAKLLLVHVVPPLPYPTAAFLPKHFATMEKQAREEMRKWAQRIDLKPDRYRSLVFEREDAARVIARVAKRSRVAMIVMSSHGRAGLERLILGSVLAFSCSSL